MLLLSTSLVRCWLIPFLLFIGSSSIIYSREEDRQCFIFVVIQMVPLGGVEMVLLHWILHHRSPSDLLMTHNTVEDCRQGSGKGIIPSIPRHSFRCGNFHIYRSAMGINHDLGLLSLLLRLLMDITMEGTTLTISEYVVSLLISWTRPQRHSWRLQKWIQRERLSWRVYFYVVGRHVAAVIGGDEGGRRCVMELSILWWSEDDRQRPTSVLWNV